MKTLLAGLTVAMLGATTALAASFPTPTLYPSFTSRAGRYVTIDPPGSIQSSAVAVNASGVVAGNYLDLKGREHGFIRDTSGNIVKIDAPDAGSKGTHVTDLNANGEVSGKYSAHNTLHGFARSADGTYTEFDIPNSTETSASRINDAGTITGNFTGTDNKRYGFLRTSDGTITTFDASDCTTPRSINNKGVVAGTTCPTQGFLRTASGKITGFEAPGAFITQVTGLNESRAVCGYFLDNQQILHGYIRHPNGSFAIVDSPHAGTQPGQDGTSIDGINNAGEAIGLSMNNAAKDHAFIRSPGGRVTEFGLPHATLTRPESINDSGAIAGYYFAADESEHAFLRMP